ncbi:uncharacterized protein LOC111036383 [Myzus persicae]|uniref:uncharacterized protein LOC111036383 n=1 Tax=Myzus persicae TaxID=13164 RepID=UPI000B9346A4|nr:uncharacterized protein LOC111036383 [Myzus persicae]
MPTLPTKVYKQRMKNRKKYQLNQKYKIPKKTSLQDNLLKMSSSNQDQLDLNAEHTGGVLDQVETTNLPRICRVWSLAQPEEKLNQNQVKERKADTPPPTTYIDLTEDD